MTAAAIQLKITEKAGTPIIVLDHVPREAEFREIIGMAREILTQTKRRGEVYFIYDYSDTESANRLSPGIERFTGLRVAPPQPGETYSQSKLVESDGVVLFRANAAEKWFIEYREKIQQAAALRRGRTIPEAYYLVQPGEPPNLTCTLNVPNRWEIDRVGIPDVADLRPFFDALSSPANATAGGLR